MGSLTSQSRLGIGGGGLIRRKLGKDPGTESSVTWVRAQELRRVACARWLLMLMSGVEQGSVETVVGGANETPPLRWVTKCQATIHLRKASTYCGLHETLITPKHHIQHFHEFSHFI